MSLLDEIERAKKTAAEERKKYEEGQVEARRLYGERLDAVFARHYAEIESRDNFFIENIHFLEIINTLDELRRIADLKYGYTYKKEIRQTPAFFGSKSTTETVATPIPAKLTISRRFENGKTSRRYGKSIYDGAAIEMSQTGNSNWKLSLTDFHNWESYRHWKGSFHHSTVEKDFQNQLDRHLGEIASLEIPTIDGMIVELLWNFREGDTDIPNSDSVDSFEIYLSRQEVEIYKHSKLGSISLDECTSQWIKQKVAEAYVKYKFH
jgi:hypothetical protein